MLEEVNQNGGAGGRQIPRLVPARGGIVTPLAFYTAHN